MELSKNKLSIYASLGSAKMRRKHSLFTVEGRKAVSDTLSHFQLEALICLDTCRREFENQSGNFYVVDESTINKISNLSTPSDVIAVYKLPQHPEDTFEISENDIYVVLDDIQDPGNLGTIIRTCHWFGISAIFASKNTVDVYNPKTIQSTMGSIAHVKIEYCDLEKLFLSHPEMPVYGLLLDGKSIYKSDLGGKGFILMGNEGKGISPQLRKFISNPLLIPPATQNHSESLNVAVATGITLSCFSAKR